MAIDALLRAATAGHALPGEFYFSAEIWAADVARVLERKWHFVGHRAQIPNPGDFLTLDIAEDSLIVVRGHDGVVRAFHNVCRHRGARLCTATTGHARHIVCPYHAWRYGLDGRLEHAPRMPDDFDPQSVRLQPCHAREFEGLLLVCLADEPPDFDALFGDWRGMLEHYGIAGTRIARRVGYTIDANWKFVIENGLECYHCYGVHPTFARTRSRALVRSIGTSTETCDAADTAALAAELEAWRATLRERPQEGGVLIDDGPDSDHLRGFSRLPLASGYLTESVDGGPVAPLLGRLREYDRATTVMMFNPWSWIFISSDYAATFRWTAVTRERTDWEMLWLVRGDARPGVDFDADRVARVHLQTALEDKAMIERVRDGVRSRRYRPGRLSRQEASVARFNDWYLRQLSGGIGGDRH